MNKEKLVIKLKWFFTSFIWLGILVLVLDIVSKNLVIAANVTPGSIINDLIPGFLAISYVINTNAAFGLGASNPLTNRIVYIVVAIIAIAIMLFIYAKKYKKLGKFIRACLMLMVVGALGNLIDRIAYTPSYLRYSDNGVVDWIDFYGVWKFNFNIADASIVIGTIMLIIFLIVQEIIEYKKEKALKVSMSKQNPNDTNKEIVQPIKEEKSETEVVEKKNNKE